MKRSRLVLPYKEYKALVAEVHTRDSWRCRVKTCRIRQDLHAHHIVYRSHQGDDIRQNLITLCNSCHEALHNRYIIIRQGDNEVIDADKPVRWEFLDGWTPQKARRR